MIHRVHKDDLTVQARRAGAKEYLEQLKAQLALPGITPEQKKEILESISKILRDT